MGYPSSLNYNGVWGVAYNNHVAQVRCITIVHLRKDGDRWLVTDHVEEDPNNPVSRNRRYGP